MTVFGDAAGSLADRVAESVSVAMSPLLMPTVVTILILLDIGSLAAEIVPTVLVVFVAFFLFPLTDILWMIRRGKTSTLDVPNRRARTEAFVTAVIAGSVAVIAIREFGMPGEPVIHAILVTYIINLILVMGINVTWKISVHMVALSGSLAILLMLAGLSGVNSPVLRGSTVLPFLALIPIVGWARCHLRAHTPAQIVVGAIVGFCCHWLALLAQIGR